MQNYNDIPDTTTLTASRSVLLNNILTALSSSSGTAFPTTNLQVGMPCFRTDQQKLYILKDTTPTWILLLDLSTGAGSVGELNYSALVHNSGAASEGGEVRLEKPASGSTLTGNLTVDLYNDQLRFFDSGGTGKGFYIDLSLGAASAATKIWHDANDGAGSGLDADTLDGQQASYFAPIASPTFTGTPAAPTAAVGTNTTQIATCAFVLANTPPAFPSGTRLAFNQTAAPTGWTKDTTAALNDSIMRIVTGTVGSGGSNAFSTFNSQTTVGATTLAESQIPSHTHSGGAYTNTTNLSTTTKGTQRASVTPTGATGGGGSHNHTITTGIKYNDFIIASKD